MSNQDQSPEKKQFTHPQPSQASTLNQREELLSAYLDGEVTPVERRQVEQWLRTDPQFKAQYLHWLEVRAQWRSMTIPPASISAQQLAEQLFEQFDRRTGRTLVWSGTAIAAVLIAALSGFKPSLSWFSFEPQLSQSSEVEPLRIALHEPVVPMVNPDAVQVSVDQPLIQIPKAAHSSPQP